MSRKKKQENHSSVFAQASEKTGLPIDVLGGYPQIRIYYGRELVIEGKCRLAEYTSENVCALCRKLKITVAGRALCVKLMDEHALVVCGVISAISFEE